MFTNHLAQNPELGRKIGNHFRNRYLVVEGSIIIYEIVLGANPMIVVRNLKPRKTE